MISFLLKLEFFLHPLFHKLSKMLSILQYFYFLTTLIISPKQFFVRLSEHSRHLQSSYFFGFVVFIYTVNRSLLFKILFSWPPCHTFFFQYLWLLKVFFAILSCRTKHRRIWYLRWFRTYPWLQLPSTGQWVCLCVDPRF